MAGIDQIANLVQWVAVPPPSSASAAYAAWLSELGVADAPAGFDYDDARIMFDGVPFMAGASTRMFWSSEGGLGMFVAAPANEAQRSLELTPAIRNYSTTTPPDLLLYCLDTTPGDRQTLESRLAIAGGTLVIFAGVRQLSSTSGRVDVALRVTAGRIDVAVTNVTASTPVIRAYPSAYGALLTAQTLASGFIGTVAYELTPARDFVPLSTQRGSVDYVVGRGSASFTAKPVLQHKTVDLRDRAPFGMPMVTNELTGNSVYMPWQFKGRGRIAGTVKEKASPTDKPVARRVRLYREPDGRLIRTTWSDPVTGAYEFRNLPMDTKYTVVSHDYAGLYRAVLADNLAPELIP
jgi:hypothetical protein